MESAQRPNGFRSRFRTVAKGALVVVAVIVTIQYALFKAFVCGEGPGMDELSRDGKLAASNYVRSCRGKQSVEVSIHSSDSLAHGPGNVFSATFGGVKDRDAWPVFATWSDSGLDVQYDPRVEIHTKLHEFQGIRINYRQDTRSMPAPGR